MQHVKYNHASETVMEGKNITVDLFNARSISNKSEMLRERIYTVDKSTDILALTETWLREGDDATTMEICPPGYKFIGMPRYSCVRGGGVGFVVAPDTVADKSSTTNNFRTFELLTIKVKAKQPLHLFLIYRPPPSKHNKLTVPLCAHQSMVNSVYLETLMCIGKTCRTLKQIVFDASFRLLDYYNDLALTRASDSQRFNVVQITINNGDPKQSRDPQEEDSSPKDGDKILQDKACDPQTNADGAKY
ncbi:hypothetical protein CAPTEDRAFT_212467 [Capitella teleta]|uniref:Uncharacterized protein n=1 Tax=Capitella teleta TaxID=283909 RepID=R7TZ52_CAPTE|nr:hypothetical protein CAPTEDRAFT_212467 [Capitella teleta]|eukprot:ELT99034.1 hypothetical protein CAPTEDRAFT_212467 [Capitella teleta]